MEEVKFKLNREQHQVHSQKKKQCLEESLEDFREQARNMSVKSGELSKEIALLRKEVDVQQNIIDKLLGSDQMIVTRVDGKYTDEVRQCCFDLLSMNVGVWNIQPVINPLILAGGHVRASAWALAVHTALIPCVCVCACVSGIKLLFHHATNRDQVCFCRQVSTR